MDALRTMGIEAKDPDYIATTGWTTKNLIQGISSRLNEEKKYNLVSIVIGVNNQYQGIPVVSYEPDLKNIIDLALDVVDQDSSRVFILSIPDYAYTPFGAGNILISREIDEYNGIKRRIAGEFRIAFIDITPISREGLDNPSLVATDGLHPSEDQYSRWVEAVIPRLQIDGAVPVLDRQQKPGDSIMVYPNPAASTCYIDSTGAISRISILNAAGLIISDQMVSDLPFQLDISNMESGVYFLKIFHGQQDTFSHRILVVQG